MAIKRVDQRIDGLIAILKEKSDLALLQNEGWYRIPIKSAPKRWPPAWMAFYQPKLFGDEAYQIKYYGNVKDIRRVKRFELFPNEIISIRSEQEYYQVFFDELLERPTPIICARPRRIVFIPTTRTKFEKALIINDLFDESPLEDKLWMELKSRTIDAERQWRVEGINLRYYLDFAIFCKNGKIDVETDGDTYHLERSRVSMDNARDNALQIDKWMVLRFNTQQISSQFETECLARIQNGINTLGGLKSDGMITRVFYTYGKSHSQQLSLFENAITQYRNECDQEGDIEHDN